MPDYRPEPNCLDDHVILVTGAGDGIGRAIARGYAQYGATVVLLGRTIRKLEKVYDEIESAQGPQPAIYPMNFEGATPKDYADLAAVIHTEFGRLDGLLHNAAELGDLRGLDAFDVMTWAKVMQTNLNGPFLLTQSCLPALRAATRASVLFTHDSVADTGKAYWGAYGVSKGGLLTLMRMFSEELEANTRVRVNAVDPGPVHTGLRLKAYPAEDRRGLREPESLVPLYVHLMSAETDGINGRLVRADDPLPLIP